MSVQQQLVSSAVLCQLSCNLSALAYCVMQFICYDRPAARHQLSYEVQTHLQSVISAAIYLLSHDMSAWQQSVSLVCQFSCNTAAQLYFVSSAAIRRLSYNSSTQLLAETKLVISAATCWVSCSLLIRTLSTRLQFFSSTVFCQLGCAMLADFLMH